MTHYVIQKEPYGADNVQIAILTELIRKNRYSYSCSFMCVDDFYKDQEDEESFSMLRVRKTAEEFDEQIRNAVPVGTVRFIELFLQTFKGIKRENSIEVPAVLRTEEFLKRKYSIVPRERIPRTGQWFLKDATRQKLFSYKGAMEDFLNDEMFEPPKSELDASLRLEPDHLYQVSEIVPILAEYRVYVINKKLNSLCAYAGDPLVFPDAELIRKAIRLINEQPDMPRSYSIDVMVTNRGTAITEVHNFLSLGLYTVDWDEELLLALRQGLEYVERFNVEPTEFESGKNW